MQLSKERPDLNFNPGDVVQAGTVGTSTVVCWIGQALLLKSVYHWENGQSETMLSLVMPAGGKF